MADLGAHRKASHQSSVESTATSSLRFEFLAEKNSILAECETKIYCTAAPSIPGRILSDKDGDTVLGCKHEYPLTSYTAEFALHRIQIVITSNPSAFQIWISLLSGCLSRPWRKPAWVQSSDACFDDFVAGKRRGIIVLYSLAA